MHYKVPAITLYVNEHTAVFRLGPINGHPHGVVVETAAGGRVELPAVPGAAQDTLVAKPVAARIARDALANGPEAERAAVVWTAVADAAQLPVHRDHPNLAPSDPRDDVAVALEVGDRADVLPAHARASPSRSP